MVAGRRSAPAFEGPAREVAQPQPIRYNRGMIERTLPLAAALWRKVSFASDTEAGSWFAERLLIIVATCRQQGRRLLDLLVAAGEAVLWGLPAPFLMPASPGS